MNANNAMSPAERVRSIAGFFLRPSIGLPSRATLLVRLAAGSVFVSSGLIKFLFENQGPGRFAKIGLPSPTELAYWVGTVEIVCGTLLLVGLVVRIAAMPLIVDMAVAIVATKLPLLFGPGPEPVGAMPKVGFWAFAYQARLDFTMLASCIFLVAAGAGFWSLDALLSRQRWKGRLMNDPRLGGRAPAS